MKVIGLNDRPNEERPVHIRQGHHTARNILEGDPARPDNFSFRIAYVDNGFGSNRHHHNFDQWRYLIEGETDYGTDGKMREGSLGYFPEGAYYAEKPSSRRVVAMLQFGGPSGSGYYTPHQLAPAHSRLEEIGTFEKGIFRRDPGVAGKPTQDSYEALWEQSVGREIQYPQPQYATPIIMDSDAYSWLPIEGSPGAFEKALGTFTQCKFRAAKFKLEAGASTQQAGRGIFLVLRGSGTASGQPYDTLTTVYAEAEETVDFVSTEETELLLMGLPSGALMSTPPVAAASAPAS